MKGISPLIATVLLIAFTIAVAGILSNFLIDFTSESAGTATDRASEDIECAYSGLAIQSASYNSSTTTLSLTVRNNGHQDLEDFKMTVIRTNNTQADFEVSPNSTEMSPGDEIIFTNSSITQCSTVNKVIFISATCPNDARSEVPKASITSCS